MKTGGDFTKSKIKQKKKYKERKYFTIINHNFLLELKERKTFQNIADKYYLLKQKV